VVQAVGDVGGEPLSFRLGAGRDAIAAAQPWSRARERIRPHAQVIDFRGNDGHAQRGEHVEQRSVTGVLDRYPITGTQAAVWSAETW
jgi:hypothetical protein